MFKKLLALLLIPSLAFGQAASSVIAEKPIIQGATGVQVVVTGTGEIRLVTSADTTAKGFYLDSSTGNLTSVGSAGIVSSGNIVLSGANPVGVVRSDNTTYLGLSGGTAVNSSAAGANLLLYGASGGGSAGTAYIFGGNQSTGNILLQTTHASAQTRFLNSSSGITWLLNDSGQLVQDGTNGGDIIITKNGSGLRKSGTGDVLHLSGGSTLNSSTAGGGLSLFGGTSGGSQGLARLFGGNQTTGHIELQTNNASAEIRFQTSGATKWIINNTGDIIPSAAGSYVIGSASLPVSNVIVGNATINGSLSHSVGNTSVVVGSTTNHEIEFRANAAEVWEMNPDGTFIGSGTATIGWTVLTGVNLTCTTSCVTPCVMGQDLDTANGPWVGCGSATAERCICAGAS